MGVTELNQQELEQLREAYFQQLLEMDYDVLGGITSADEISMSNVIAHYEGINFVKEDFWCNI